MLYDFHTHTFLSDGALSPVELARRALVRGYTVLGIADHVGPGTCEATLRQVIADCQVVNEHWPLLAIPAVELTHVPVAAIARTARLAKELGALIVVAHGESIVEPVEPGTNLASLRCPDVDILAHPGMLTEEEAELAAANGVFLELSARKGHSLTNGLVFRVGQKAGARFLVNSDGHEPEDLLTVDWARQVAMGAGLDAEQVRQALEDNPRHLLDRVGLQPPTAR
ncbi:MAG: histidinol phosphate phosphatase domain-containing protein [Chloroflexota bacterium]